jgi:ankyrin repeat protein
MCLPEFQTRVDPPASTSPLKMVILRLWSSWLRKVPISMLVVSPVMELLTPLHVLTWISDKDGCTSLCRASQNGHLKVVKFLLEKGANVNASGEFNSETSGSLMCAHLNFRRGWIYQPLHCLSKWSSWGCGVPGWERCKFQCQWWVWLKDFWIPHVCSPEFQTRMDTPASMLRRRMVSLRLQSSWLRKVQISILMVCSAQEPLDPAHALTLNQGLEGFTSLLIASQRGHLNIVKFLVKKGADVNSSCVSSHLDPSHMLTWMSAANGVTSLYSASRNGHLEVVKFMVGRGANVNASREFNSETSGSLMCTHLNFRHRWIHQPLRGLS